MDRNIKVIVSDLDGVIRYFPEERDGRIESAHRLPRGSLSRVAFAPDQLKRVITGELSDEDWRDSICASLLQDFPGADAVAAVREWSDFSGEIDFQVLSHLESLSRGRKLVLLTNATSRLNRDLDRAGLSETFAYIFNSSELGIAKPEREIFLLVCGFLQVLPEEALFIDDSQANVIAAREAGLLALHFTGLAKLRSDTEAFLASS